MSIMATERQGIGEEIEYPDIEPLYGVIPAASFEVKHVGITGSRHHIPSDQGLALNKLLFGFKPCEKVGTVRRTVELHHGCCYGFDSLAHHLGCTYGYDVSLHPANNVPEWRNHSLIPRGRGVAYSARPTHKRNAHIACMSDVLIAGPAYGEFDSRSERSGAWQTIRLARAEGITIYYAYPDGKLYRERGAGRIVPLDVRQEMMPK